MENEMSPRRPFLADNRVNFHLFVMLIGERIVNVAPCLDSMVGVQSFLDEWWTETDLSNEALKGETKWCQNVSTWKKKRVENRLIKSNPFKSLNCLRSVWWFLWWFFSFSPMHSGLLQRLQTHWHPNVCLSWCNGRVWGLTTNFFEFYSFTLQIHIQINWSHKFSQIFPLQTLMMLMGFGWFSVFFCGKHTPCPSRMPVSNQGVELTPSRSVTRRWGENQNLSERLRFGDGKLSWNAWNMYIYYFGNR